VFQNRSEAGRHLSAALTRYADCGGLVLAIPRGGVVVGLEVSLALRLPLDVLITRKIGMPNNPELALGALSETGSLHLNEELVSYLSSTATLEQERQRQEEEIARRRALYRQGRTLPSLVGRTVLLVDDGVATGATYLASVDALKAAGAARVVAALPVAPPDTAEKIAQQVDDCVVLATPWPFFAVGEHYADFRQVEDAEVVRCLAEAHRPSRTESA